MRAMKKKALVAVAALALVFAYPVWLGYQIWDQSHQDEVHSADAIVVLGAAQYDGDPSPVFQARLDHAAYLYHEDLADTVIVTGGKQKGDRFTEAEAGRTYLVEDRDVPSEAILSEDDGTTTLESLEGVDVIAEGAGIDSILLVSDPLHNERIKRMADDLGFSDAWTSAANYEELNRSRTTKAKELVREVASLIVYELLGR
jgi:vancomycin permeability regulator SanA